MATTVEALAAAPVFFHGKQIVVRAEVEAAGQLTRLASAPRPTFVFWRETPTVVANSEIRGEFWDIGRLERTDPRFSSIDFQPILEAASNGQWPARDQVFVILGATAAESPLPADPTIRALALAPDSYVGKGVTVTGRFRGANLLADLPMGAGTKGRWDFVLQAADAAIWVTGIRPRGHGFDLDVNSRLDTGRWLQVTGTVRREGALAFIEATAVAQAKAPDRDASRGHHAACIRRSRRPRSSSRRRPQARPTRSAPSRSGYSSRATWIPSRSPATCGWPTPDRRRADAPPMPSFTIHYTAGVRALEITLSAPLDRYRAVKVDLLDGITSAIDNQPLAPWSLTFTTGG